MNKEEFSFLVLVEYPVLKKYSDKWIKIRKEFFKKYSFLISLIIIVFLYSIISLILGIIYYNLVLLFSSLIFLPNFLLLNYLFNNYDELKDYYKTEYLRFMGLKLARKNERFDKSYLAD